MICITYASLTTLSVHLTVCVYAQHKHISSMYEVQQHKSIIVRWPVHFCRWPLLKLPMISSEVTKKQIFYSFSFFLARTHKEPIFIWTRSLYLHTTYAYLLTPHEVYFSSFFNFIREISQITLGPPSLTWYRNTLPSQVGDFP